jgi:hypothetical protein
MKKIIEKVYDWKEARAWKKYKKEFLSNKTTQEVIIYETLLDNERKHLIQHDTCNDNTKHKGFWCSTFCFTKPPFLKKHMFILSVVKQVLDKMALKELVGVQPIQDPVSRVYNLQFSELDPKPNRKTIQVVSSVVEAHTRKLHTSWAVEAKQDLHSLSNVNAEQEITRLLADELVYELTTDVLDTISSIAESSKITLNQTKSVEFNQNEIISNITRLANSIADDTRRGTGNWVVLDYDTYNLLASTKHPSCKFKRISKSSAALTFVGTLNETIKVYVVTKLTNASVLVGYKGTGEVDAGFIWSPYTMIMLAGLTIDSDTFIPRQTLLYRGGQHIVDGEFTKGQNYYRTLTIE